MPTYVPDAITEQVIDLWAGVDIYVALFTGDPGENGSANESTGLSRVLLASATDWNSAVDDGDTTGRLVDNSVLVDFGNTTVEETYTHFGFFDDESAGNYMGGAQLVSPVGPVAVGEGVRFPIGNLDLVAFGVA